MNLEWFKKQFAKDGNNSKVYEEFRKFVPEWMDPAEVTAIWDMADAMTESEDSDQYRKAMTEFVMSIMEESREE